ncbi:MAG: hypothetical protein AABX98_03155 [Nanoarchaeota archaeon]
MIGSIFHIKVNSSEENKDNGFSALITSGTSVTCLKNDEYIVNEDAVRVLNQKKVIYELVPKKSVSHENLGVF